MSSTEPESDFDDRLERALSILADRGLRRSTYAPMLHRLLWQMKVPMRPPHFAGFVSNLVYMGGGFGLCWGAIMWLLIWGPGGLPIWYTSIHVAVASGLFGLIMAAYFAYSARKHSLPAWEDVFDEPSVFD